MRNYQAAHELSRISGLAAFNIQGATKTERLNQHATVATFADGSLLWIHHTTGLLSSWHPNWTGSAADVELGPIVNVPSCASTRGKRAA